MLQKIFYLTEQPRNIERQAFRTSYTRQSRGARIKKKYVVVFYNEFSYIPCLFWISGIVFLLKQFKHKKGIMPGCPGQLEPTFNQFWKTVLFNQFFITVPFLCLVEFIWMNKKQQFVENDGKNIFELFLYAVNDIAQLFIMIQIEEVIFYVIHRFILHSSWGYKYIHHIHHQFKIPNPFASIYAHPIEHILQNLLPLFLAWYVVGASIRMAVVWIILATINSNRAHIPRIICARITFNII